MYFTKFSEEIKKKETKLISMKQKQEQKHNFIKVEN